MMSRIRQHLVQILHLREPTHRTALAFALGVVIAFSPLYGFHTAGVFLFAWAFRLNFIALMAGALINNPWTLAPFLALTFWTGFTVTGTTPVALQWDDLSPATLYDQIIPYLLPFMAGGFTLSLLGGMVSYPLAYVLIARYRAGGHRKGPDREPLLRETRVG